MKSTNEKKPINVLTAFITDWVRDNSSESAPFDSFEVMKGKRIEQKDVERWIFNCNYLYYRLGEFLYVSDLFPNDETGTERLLSQLDTRFKSIKDSNPLNLRSKQHDAIVAEFAKDWPPMTVGSRNRIGRFDAAFEALAPQIIGNGEASLNKIDIFRREITNESAFYRKLKPANDTSRTHVLSRCRELLPIWIIKEINPLYSLLLWQDEEAVEKLCRQLRQSFESAGLPSYDGSLKHDSYTGLVMRAQRTYLEGLGINDDSEDLRAQSVADIHALLDAEFFSLEHPSPSKRLPAWLYGKSQLIWNIVICAIFGPREALTGSRPLRTSTILSAASAEVGSPEALQGEVLLRRRYCNGKLETIDRLPLDEVQSSGLWKVIGSSYDENAALPDSEYRNQYRNLGALFIGSQRFDGAGNTIEGAGDSRFHAEISIEIRQNGTKRLILRDLHSKNGTYVLRREHGKATCHVLVSRQRRSAEQWASLVGLPVSSVTIEASIALHRGDIIQLCGSCFEVI